MELIGYALSVAALVYLGFGALLYFAQDAFVFVRGGSVWRTPGDLGWKYEDVTVSVDGETTHGWLITRDRPRGVVLFSHGNAGTIADRLETVDVFRNLGFDVLAYDYGGYGRSTGRPSESRCYADVRAMWNYLTKDRGIPAERIVLFGRSIGAAPAIDLAVERTPGAVIIESAFLSAVQIGREAYPVYPVRLLMRHRFESDRKIGDVTAPKLFIHSPDDEVVPYRHGRALFERAGEPKAFLEIEGSHNGGWLASSERYVKGLSDFLDAVFAEAADGVENNASVAADVIAQ